MAEATNHPSAPAGPVGGRSASRIPVPIAEYGTRSVTQMAGRGNRGLGVGLPVLDEGTPSQALATSSATVTVSPLASSAAGVSLVRRGSDTALDECDHAPHDIRDAGDSALLWPSAARPTDSCQVAPSDEPGDTSVTQSTATWLETAAPNAEMDAIPAPVLAEAAALASDSSTSVPAATPNAPTHTPPALSPSRHQLLLEVVAMGSRSLLATAQAADSMEHVTVVSGGGGAGSVHVDRGSELFLSTSASLELPASPTLDQDKAKMSGGPSGLDAVPEVIVTGATPILGTPSEHEQHPAAPAALQAQLLAGAPPAPPPTPDQACGGATPDRKESPVVPTAAKRTGKQGAGQAAVTLRQGVAAARNAPGRRVAAASSSCPASDASVTLIKAPATPRGQGSHGGPSAGPASTVRPVSARSVRSATATTGTPTVTTKATAGKKAADVASPGGLHQAARSVSATVNRRASASASAAACGGESSQFDRNHKRDPALQQQGTAGARPKAIRGPGQVHATLRPLPRREPSSLSTTSSAASKQVAKHDAVQAAGSAGRAVVKRPASQHRPSPGPGTSSKDDPAKPKKATRPSTAGGTSGAGEDVDVAALRSLGVAFEGREGWEASLDSELTVLTAPTAPALKLVAALSSRHGALRAALAEALAKAPGCTDGAAADAGAAATLAEESQFAANELPQYQADTIRTMAQRGDAVRGLIRCMAEERSLLESENKDLVRKLKECTEDLERERAARAKVKSTKVAQDVALKQTRARVKELEAKAAEDEAKTRELEKQLQATKEKLRSRGTVLEQRGKELDVAMARIAELEARVEASAAAETHQQCLQCQQLDSKLGSVTQMLHIETRTREKAEHKLKEASAKLSHTEMSHGDAGDQDLEDARRERDDLKARLEVATSTAEADIGRLRDELRSVMAQLEARSRQLDDKDAELQHILALRPGEPTREEVDALKETMAQLVAHNERLEKELGNSRQEAAQRDKLLEEMENVLHVRDDIIHAVHGASGSRGAGLGTGAISTSSTPWPGSSVDGRKLVELYGKLERKSVQLKAEEQRAQQLERQNDSLQGVRTKLEMRVAQLEQLLFEKSACMLAADKTCRPRGITQV